VNTVLTIKSGQLVTGPLFNEPMRVKTVHANGNDMGRVANNTRIIRGFIKSYSQDHVPIEVNFRELVDWIPYSSERATHLIHPYPAKLLLHIPHLFLTNDLLSAKDDLVFDPFSGSGTVLLESLLTGRNAYGIDANPLARLISKVKTTPLSREQLRAATRSLLKTIVGTASAKPPDVINLDHWFYPHIIRQLAIIWSAIQRTNQNDIRDFFAVTFSSCVRHASLADPRISVPVRQNPLCYPRNHWLRQAAHARLNRLRRFNVFAQFQAMLETNIQRMADLVELTGHNRATVAAADARDLLRSLPDSDSSPITKKRVQVIITSPPYAGAQKYVRASSLSLGWLELCHSDQLRAFEGLMIGREHYHKSEYATLRKTGIAKADELLEKIYAKNPLRAYIAANYLVEMDQTFTGCLSVLKPGGYFVLVAANNRVCGYDFETKNYLAEVLHEGGLKLRFEIVDAIKSRGLMTKRNKTASVISRESVFLFQKI
jgi:DNA modification methylase